MKHLDSIVGIALLSGAALTVSAQPAPFYGGGPIPYETFDRNGDGVISREEYNRLYSGR